MASVERLAREDGDGREIVVYRVRWRDPDGRQRSKSYKRKRDADRHRTRVEADLLRGQYVDPDAGKVTFNEYATTWWQAQTFDPMTAVAVELRLRLHAYPVLGTKPLRSIKPSTVQGWLRGLDGLAPNYRKVIFANVSSVFAAAVDDGELTTNPCRASSVSKPSSERKEVVPWSRDWVLAMDRELPRRYAIFVTLAAGLGLRQGEVFGLSPEDVDFLRGKVDVKRQVKVFPNNKLVFALPKGRKVRTVPLPESVKEALAMYLARRPARRITLPWERLDGAPITVPLVMTTRESKAVNKNYFNPFVWKTALRACGIEDDRRNGCHALRHFYASTLLDAGETIKALSIYLGHSDPGFTLRTYTHLMPASDERTKKAVDAVLGVPDVYSPPDESKNMQVKGGS